MPADFWIGFKALRFRVQEHADKLSEVLDIVIAHQGAPLAAKLVSRLLAALVEPSPEDYRTVLRRLASLEGETLSFYSP